MITVTNRDTLMAAYIDPKNILRIESFTDEKSKNAYPYSRVFLKDDKEGHEYFLDAIETKETIERMIRKSEDK